MGDRKSESWEQYRRRMLDETSRFIEWGLKHPELVIEIPVKPADDGGFPPRVGEWFWTVVLSDGSDGRLRRWRELLLSRPAGLLRKLGNRRGGPMRGFLR